ncbi:glycerate kinase [Halanaerobiaceae bacterium Z-7014]|uniref:Glycerate kinase n=1 Tax=Halonatronomonas betaini TaxID=2778430 RepID=A0A931F6N1_9FIRM|nr:glycerate kinase [Halonatronomonas betaini]MBF8437110.1 glycerate kinase [Halonatronomonas betaini]
MKIIIAPDSYKGSLTALEVAENIETGIKKTIPEAEIIKVPMADGGEGTVQALVDAHNGQIIEEEVIGPEGDRVKAFYGILNESQAVIEMAAASGISYIDPATADPRKTTTYGTGQLIKSALKRGASHIILGIGGSATMDAGVGALQALGFSFKDKAGQEIGRGGGQIGKIASVSKENLYPPAEELYLEIACDVSNPFYGENGAAYIYGPQKGASQKQVEELDQNFRKFNQFVRDNYNKDLQQLPGAGAAGGLGAGLITFLNGELKEGADIVARANQLAAKLKGADLVITGEGQLDYQTVNNKAPIHVAHLAGAEGIPVLAIAGSLGEDYQKVFQKGIDAAFSIINKPASLNKIILATPELLQETARNIGRLITLDID